MTIFERVQKLIAQELNISKDKITEESHLFDDLNFDSLDSVQIVLELEQEFDIEVSDDEIDNTRTVKDILDLIENLS
jgi:acyl carrier protein